MRIRPRSYREGDQTIRGWEYALCALVFLACIAMQFAPVYNRAAFLLQVVLTVVSNLSPLSGLLYLSAAQVLPEAPGAGFLTITCSKMAVLGALPWLLRTDWRRLWAGGGKLYLVFVLPFFLWVSAVNLLRPNLIWPLVVLFCLTTGLVALAMVKKSGDNYLACFLVIMAGQAVAFTVFWMIKTGVGTPVQAFDIDIYGDALDAGARIGTARGNANTLGAPMALVLVGVTAWLFHAWTSQKHRLGASLLWLSCIVFCGPPLIASGSRGAMVSAAVGVVAIPLIFRARAKTYAVFLALVVTALVGLVGVGWNLGLREHLEEIQHRQQIQEGQQGTVLGGRSDVWSEGLECLLDSPILGGGRVVTAAYSGREEMWASHNTYLDAGITAGIPGILFYCLLLYGPILGVWSRRAGVGCGIALAVAFFNVLYIAAMPAMQSKMTWVIGAILCVVLAERSQAVSGARRISPLGRRRQ